MKAYCCKERDGDGYAVIVYGKTRGQAKREGASELDIDFLDANVSRLPWADEYRDMDDIPAEEFLAHGWWLPCAKCGKQVDEDTAVLTDTKVLCKECAGKDGER